MGALKSTNWGLRGLLPLVVGLKPQAYEAPALTPELTAR